MPRPKVFYRDASVGGVGGVGGWGVKMEERNRATLPEQNTNGPRSETSRKATVGVKEEWWVEGR